MALDILLQRLLEHLPAVVTVALMSIILIQFVWKNKQKKKRDFSEKSVFITSCDTALGFDVARKMDKLGFSVFAGFIMADGEAARRLKGKTSNRLSTVEIDVTDDNQVCRAVQLIERKLDSPGLYCLINTAAVTMSGNFQWYTPSQCQRLLDVNVMGTIRTIKYFLPLLQLGKGRIINVTGTSGRLDCPLLSVQSASKAAVNRYSDLLRHELGDMGIVLSTVEHEDGMPFTINLTEKDEINEMRLNMSGEQDESRVEEMYQWHRAQDAKAKRSLKAEADLLKLELDMVEDAITSNVPKFNYSPLSGSKKMYAVLLKFIPRSVKSRIIKIPHTTKY